MSGWLDRLRRVLWRSRREIPPEARDFVAKLAVSEIWILAIGVSGVPEIPTNADAALDAVAAHRKDLADLGDEDSVFPFNYQSDGRQLLPFFSSEELARHFLSTLGVSSISVFQPYRLLAGFVASPPNDAFEPVLDPRTPSERRLSREERLLLRSLDGAPGKE